MIAIIILLSGCRTKPSGVSRCIHFDFTQEMKDVHTMGLLKDCTIVPLETNDSVLIGEIDKVIFTKPVCMSPPFLLSKRFIFLTYRVNCCIK